MEEIVEAKNDSQSIDNSSEKTKIIIKKGKFKNRPLRVRRVSGSDSDDQDTSCISKIEEMKTVQKLRERPRGVEVSELLAAAGPSAVQGDSVNSDAFKVKTGGMVNMKNVSNLKQSNDDAYDVGIGTQFSAETNKRDEDEEMMKYIDEQLSKKVVEEKREPGDTSMPSSEGKYCTPEDAALLAVPQHLRINSGARSEEMLSNQMLSGIPEVDLGIESKIKNIEATEEAKLKLLLSQRNKADGPSHFVPTNVAVNFASKGNAESTRRGEKRPIIDAPPKEKQSNNKGKEKATDDLHYERFRKQFRR